MLINSKCGYLDNQLKRLRKADRKANLAEQSFADESLVTQQSFNSLNQSDLNASNSIETNSAELDSTNKEKVIEDFELLKATVVNEANMPLIKEKMVSTMKHRSELLKIPEVDLLESFPYLFLCPQLVNINNNIFFVYVRFTCK